MSYNNKAYSIEEDAIDSPIVMNRSFIIKTESDVKSYTLHNENEVKETLKNNNDETIIKRIQNDQKDSEEELNDNENFFGLAIIKIRQTIYASLQKPLLKRIISIAALFLFLAYFIVAMSLNSPFNFPDVPQDAEFYENYVFSNNPSLAFFILTISGFSLIIWDIVIKKYSNTIQKQLEKVLNFNKVRQIMLKLKITVLIKKWTLLSLVTILCIIYLFLMLDNYANLVSLIGIFVFVLIGIFLSEKPSKVNFKTIWAGLLLQFIFGALVIHSTFGYQLFKFFGDQVEHFLSFTNYGSRLVFGVNHAEHFFAFKAMPVLIFFGAVINVLYYFGTVQYFLLKLSWVINEIMGTSPTESVNAAANIFFGQSEAPLLIKPFLDDMTISELFAVMVGGFATVSGSTLAAYIGFGVPANHLLVASVMSAPAALSMAKLMYPETNKTKANWDRIRTLPKSDSNNLFDALCTGAVSVVLMVLNIIANLIAFVATFNFLDAVIRWFLAFINIRNAGFQTILQYIFWPLSLVMGVPVEDCLIAGKLIGLKTFINEFVAYEELGKIINFRKEAILNNSLELYKNGTMSLPISQSMLWNEKSVVISTYALCGFSNFGSIGIQISALSSLAPKRAKEIVKIALQAMIAGNIACFMTACISGLFYKPV